MPLPATVISSGETSAQWRASSWPCLLNTAIDPAVAGHAKSARAAWPDGLTDREVEVLRLISQGVSQKDVGKALAISHRTAAHHIQHIYDKIGVSTRAAAAMYSMEHDLLA